MILRKNKILKNSGIFFTTKNIFQNFYFLYKNENQAFKFRKKNLNFFELYFLIILENFEIH